MRARGTVPAKRTKANREHRVPLGGCAIEVLDEAWKLAEGTSPYLFSQSGRQATAPGAPEAPNLTDPVG